MPEKKKQPEYVLIEFDQKKTAKTEILAVFLWGQTQKGPEETFHGEIVLVLVL